MKQREAVVKHSFEQAVIRLARLSLFADKGEAAGLSYNVTNRQEQLAIDDALHLSMAVRRLVEALDLREASLKRLVLSSAASIRWLPGRKPVDLSLHETLNKIIHSQFIEVYSFSFQLGREEDIEAAYLQTLNKESFRLDPLIAIRSDRGPLSICDLRDFCKACDELLENAEDIAAQQRFTSATFDYDHVLRFPQGQ